MVRIKYNIILALLFHALLLNAQNRMTYTLEELKTKSRTDLIRIAKDILQEQSEISLPSEDFDVRVWDDHQGEIHVIFRRSTRYFSDEGEDINYDLTVDLVNQEILFARKVDDDFDCEPRPFYTPSERADELIEILKGKGLLTNINTPDIEYTITENEHYYLISCFDDLPQIDKQALGNKERPLISKTLVNRRSGKTLFFKGTNPYFYIQQRSCEHYYNECLYAILNEYDQSNSDELIEMADSILQSRYPDVSLDYSDFEMMILANYKDLIVRYRPYVRFAQRDEHRASDLTINIITGEISPLNASETPFYVPTSAEKEKIELIQSIVTLEQSPGTEHTVSENEDYYFICSIDEHSTRKYFIDKMKNECIWNHQSYTLPFNAREDLTLQAYYKRMNQTFQLRSADHEPLRHMVSEILHEKHLNKIIDLDEYRFSARARKTECQVQLTRLVKYIPYNAACNYDYDVTVHLIDRTTSLNPERFYVADDETAGTIERIEAQLEDYFNESKTYDYPIDIVEKLDHYDIIVSGKDGHRNLDDAQYRMDKKTKSIEVVHPLIHPIWPSPATMPPWPQEIVK